MGLGSAIKAGKDLVLALKVRKRFKEDVMLKGFLATLYALASFVAVSAVAQLTGACPALLTVLQPAILAGAGAAITFMIRRPADKAGAKATGTAALVAALGVGFAAFKAEITRACGADFLTQVPTLLSMGAMVGLGLYLQSPKGGGKGPGSISNPGRLAGLGVVFLALAVAMTSIACSGQLAQVSGSIGAPKLPQIKQEDIDDAVCRNDIVNAQRYVHDRGGSDADLFEKLAEARRRVAKRRKDNPGDCPCFAGGCDPESPTSPQPDKTSALTFDVLEPLGPVTASAVSN